MKKRRWAQKRSAFISEKKEKIHLTQIDAEEESAYKIVIDFIAEKQGKKLYVQVA
jgi:hypothetical protein